MMLTRLRNAVEASWYGAAGFTVLLLPLAWLFGIIAAIRRALYQNGFLEVKQASVPVVVVGNITVGGTGKTPVVAWLAQTLEAEGYSPGIVSRGYGGAEQNTPLEVGPESDPAVAGDEPVMLAELTGLPVSVCRDRAAAVEDLAARGVNVVVADDGLQHYRMQRVAEFIVVDAERGYGNGWLMPAGPLREPLSRVSSADGVLINGVSNKLQGKSFALQPGGAVSLGDAEGRPLESFRGQRVWGVAGIGNPERFYSLLHSYAIEVDRVAVPDHGVCDLGRLMSQRKQPILMTRKDAVKYRATAPDNSWYVPVEVEFGAADRQALVELLKSRLQTD